MFISIIKFTQMSINVINSFLKQHNFCKKHTSKIGENLSVTRHMAIIKFFFLL